MVVRNEIRLYQYNGWLAVGRKRGALESVREPAEASWARSSSFGRALVWALRKGDDLEETGHPSRISALASHRVDQKSSKNDSAKGSPWL
jgi:hypothetical protein